jgi:hypothetical protein
MSDLEECSRAKIKKSFGVPAGANEWPPQRWTVICYQVGSSDRAVTAVRGESGARAVKGVSAAFTPWRQLLAGLQT